MNYQGINGNEKVVFQSVTEEQKAEIQANPVYNFVRFIPIVEVEPVEAPVEVEDAETEPTNNTTDGDSDSNARPSGASKRGKGRGSKGSN